VGLNCVSRHEARAQTLCGLARFGPVCKMQDYILPVSAEANLNTAITAPIQS